MNCTSTNRVNDELKAAAFYYAGELGLPVFPVHTEYDGRCSCGKEACSSPGKHPRTRNGFKDASTDADTIEGWWTRWPDANIGMPTGQVSGIYVVDVDKIDNPAAAKLPTTLMVRTPNGVHFYYRWREGLTKGKTLHPDVDCIRTDGNYVVLPPSQHSDTSYEWMEPFGFSALAEAPILEPAKKSESHRNNGIGNRTIVEQRNVILTSIAGKMRRSGLSGEEIDGALQIANQNRCTEPLSVDEVRKIAHSVAKYEAPGETETEDSGPIIVPVPITELNDVAPIEWVWEPYLASGCITLFVALWKLGKTTLVSYLAKAMGGGGGVGCDVLEGRVLIVSEESPAMWKSRRDKLDIGNHVDVVCRPFMHRPRPGQWDQAIEEIAELVKANEYRLVIIDTLADLSPVDDENDAAKVMAAIKPLKQITEAGAALMLLHHPNKRDGGEATASRGSGALPAFVDIILEMRRFDGLRHEDTRRVLKTHSRLESAEEVLDLTADGYVSSGSKTDATKRARMEVIDGMLSTDAGMTVDQIRKEWPGNHKPPYQAGLNKDLKYGVESQEWPWRRTGEGKKGDPHLYWRAGI